MKNIALYNFIPNHCPNCGKEININNSRYAVRDFQVGASHECNCGLYFAHASTESLKKTASENDSDLARYV